jgi:hypothetical protein
MNSTPWGTGFSGRLPLGRAGIEEYRAGDGRASPSAGYSALRSTKQNADISSGEVV